MGTANICLHLERFHPTVLPYLSDIESILPQVVPFNADILPLAIAQGKIFVIKGQPVVKSRYIQAPMNYFLS